MIREDEQNSIIQEAMVSAIEAQLTISTVLSKASDMSVKTDKEKVAKVLLDFLGFVSVIPLYDLASLAAIKSVSDYVVDDSDKQSIILDFMYKLEYEFISRKIDLEFIKKQLKFMDGLFLKGNDNLFEDRTVAALEADTSDDQIGGNKWYLNIIILRYNVEAILTYLDGENNE